MKVFLASLVTLAFAQDGEDNYDTLEYINYQLSYSCEQRSALRWQYELGDDLNAASRPRSFYFDPDYSRDCQQYSTKAYGGDSGYDRGHLVASAHLRNSEDERYESHYMTNIAPQVSGFNRGQWEKTERVEACYRTLNGGIKTWGGLKYNETDNDYFEEDWGIKTPDYWWKVILAKDDSGKDQTIAWWFPNREDLGSLDEYLVSVKFIESQLNDGLGAIPIPNGLKGSVADSTWEIPQGCGRGRLEGAEDFDVEQEN